MKEARLEILTSLMAARKQILNPEQWTKGSAARTERDEPISYRSPKARKWCASGALNLVGYSLEARCALENQTPNESISAFNDAPETTHEAVISMFDRAIKSV